MSSQVIIHARYAADGSIAEIGERPAALTPQEWFAFLCKSLPDSYQAFAGGRIIFRLDPEALAALQASATA